MVVLGLGENRMWKLPFISPAVMFTQLGRQGLSSKSPSLLGRCASLGIQELRSGMEEELTIFSWDLGEWEVWAAALNQPQHFYSRREWVTSGVCAVNVAVTAGLGMCFVSGFSWQPRPPWLAWPPWTSWDERWQGEIPSPLESSLFGGVISTVLRNQACFWPKGEFF